MRWERLFGELEGHAEHAHLEERDALVADLAEGEWAARSWLAGLPEAEGLELDVIDVGILSGRVRLANAVLIHLESGSSDHLISTNAVPVLRPTSANSRPVSGSVQPQISLSCPPPMALTGRNESRSISWQAKTLTLPSWHASSRPTNDGDTDKNAVLLRADNEAMPRDTAVMPMMRDDVLVRGVPGERGCGDHRRHQPETMS